MAGTTQAVAVHTVAIIGAGTMGRGIAQAAALGGYRTILEDLLPNALRKANDEIQGALQHAVTTGGASAGEADAALRRIEYADTVEDAARQADFIIEAVPDELESKLEIFTLLDKICRPATILASNTAWLSIAELAGITYRAGKCVGMRFVVPVSNNKQLDIIRTPEAEEETIQAAVAIGQRMGKNVRVIGDTPSLPAPLAVQGISNPPA